VTSRNDIDIPAVTKRMHERRAELQGLQTSSEDQRRPVELDQTRVGRLSRMDALQSQAMSVETDRRRSIELGRIEAALERIAEGDYGYCLVCGEDIALQRLELDPTAATCISCARTSEIKH
jgi:DnaK suppressor protein